MAFGLAALRLLFPAPSPPPLREGGFRPERRFGSWDSNVEMTICFTVMLWPNIKLNSKTQKS